MAYSQPPDAGEMRATLALSQSEARTGSSRTLNLPGGRQITVSIPAGVYDGQELRVAGQGEPAW
ncbi:MAG: DnaJ C-terminal domain-containing protein, partial [Ktedonobacteraceae bacterium]